MKTHDEFKEEQMKNPKFVFWWHIQKVNWKIIFRPICWCKELYQTFRMMFKGINQPICGHTWKNVYEIEEDGLEMDVCEVCGKKNYIIFSPEVVTFYTNEEDDGK